jgi:hypothetical protein
VNGTTWRGVDSDCRGLMKRGIGRKTREEGDDMTALAGWENLFVIVGSSAGALIGLQFIVVTLLADRLG